MITLTNRTEVNPGYLIDSLREFAKTTQSTDVTWTPESQVESIFQNMHGTIFIEVQHDQFINVVADDYTVTTSMNEEIWNVYAVDDDEDNFEDVVSLQIMKDIINKFN